MFEVVRSRKYPVSIADLNLAGQVDGMDLDNYYTSPSQTKRAIYKDWKEWARNTAGISTFGVASANCMTFTITATYHNENVMGICHITKMHNYFYPVVIDGNECL